MYRLKFITPYIYNYGNKCLLIYLHCDRNTFIIIFFTMVYFCKDSRFKIEIFTLARPQCITIQDSVAIDKKVNQLRSDI